MKYTVYYNVPMQVEFRLEPDTDAHLEQQALWWARNKSGVNVDIVQILPDGVPSQLLRAQPPQGGGSGGGAPPTGPKAPAGDQLLARAA